MSYTNLPDVKFQLGDSLTAFAEAVLNLDITEDDEPGGKVNKQTALDIITMFDAFEVFDFNMQLLEDLVRLIAMVKHIHDLD